MVDGEVGFVGGMDISHGRWNTNSHDLIIDPVETVINEMYNPCLNVERPITPEEEKLCKNDLGQPAGPGLPGFSRPYHGASQLKQSLGNDVAGGQLLEEGYQPRMPWQDVQLKLEGPSVFDVYKNFIRRWNSFAKFNFGKPLTMGNPIFHQKNFLINKPIHDDLNGAQEIYNNLYSKDKGDVQVQVVRSCSATQLDLEYSELGDLSFEKDKLVEPWKTALKAWKEEPQDNILQAMLNCINSAEAYIYIETQFFSSQYGARKGETSACEVSNPLIECIANRIGAKITEGRRFHVFLVMPVHPEGVLYAGPVVNQQRLAHDGIKHGTKSLINRVSAMLVDQYVKKSKGTSTPEGKKIAAARWVEYMTFLNLRNVGVAVKYARDPKTHRPLFQQEEGRYVVTEQVYVHSKCMIVDDAVAIIGSANCNDRSLSGNGDTELAVVVVDGGQSLHDLGNGLMIPTRTFARALRIDLFWKHLGFGIKEQDYFRATQRADDLHVNKNPPIPFPPRITTTNDMLDAYSTSLKELTEQPISAAAIAAIQGIAKHNTAMYEKVFIHTPRNRFQSYSEGLSFYPSHTSHTVTHGDGEFTPFTSDLVMDRTATLQGPPPRLSDDFMKDPDLYQTGKGYFHYKKHGEKVHHVKFAMEFLKYGMDAARTLCPDAPRVSVSDKMKAFALIGFFVEMPLDWGSNIRIKQPSKASGVDLTQAEPDTLTNSTKVTA